jgi:hypothetical protein
VKFIKFFSSCLVFVSFSSFAQNLPSYGSSRNPQETEDYHSRMNMINEHIEMEAKETKVVFDKVLREIEKLNTDQSIVCAKIEHHWSNRLSFNSKCFDTSIDKLAVKLIVKRQGEDLFVEVKNKNGYILKLPADLVR